MRWRLCADVKRQIDMSLFGLTGQCLHARKLAFQHPRTGERMEVECPLPDYFQEVLRKLSMRK